MTQSPPISAPARQFAVAAGLLFAAMLACIFFLWPGRWALPGGALSSASFFLGPLVFSRCRFSFRPIVTPLNWMLFGFGLQLVFVPGLVRAVGPTNFALPSMPSDLAINFALGLITAGFWAFCICVHVFRSDSVHASRPSTRRTWIPTRRLTVVFLLIGLVGMSLSFGDIDRFIEYLTNPVAFMVDVATAAARSATFWEATGTFLKPFLGFGFLLLWCRFIDLPVRQGERGRAVKRVMLIAVIAISYALMTYNRGSFAVPMVAIIAVLSKRLGNAWRYLLAATAVFAALFGGITLYKSAAHAQASGPVDSDLIAKAATYIDVMSTLQVYGQAPQYLGYFVERVHFGSEPTAGGTLVASSMNPVPILGKPFRAHSGTYLYNFLLGRDPNFPDQIPQFAGELFLDFSIFGVLLGFSAVGWAIAKLQSRFDRSDSAIEIYILQFAAIWLGFLTVGSLEVVVQIALYSSLPIYIYLVCRAWRARQIARTTTWTTLKSVSAIPHSRYLGAAPSYES